MSDLTNLTNQLLSAKTAMYDRLIAQGDTTIQANDSLNTYLDHYQTLYRKSVVTLNVTENGIYTATNQEISGYANINVNVPTGGGATYKRYNLFDRVYGDSDSNEGIGTVCGFYTDSNSIEYAVICLDAVYRATDLQWMSETQTVTNMPFYTTWYSNVNGTETATQNTQLILDYCDATIFTSSACTHCRSKFFTIGGTTYYGQLPNICELLMIVGVRTILYNMDPTTSSVAPELNFTQNGFYHTAWSSSQFNNYSAWTVDMYMSTSSKSGSYFICPVLEIPNSI